MLFVSNIPKPIPKSTAAPTTANTVEPKPSNTSEGMVSPKPIALVYILPLIFLSTHLSLITPPITTPKKEDTAMVIVDMGPACAIGIFKLSENKVGIQFFIAQPGRLGAAK